MAAESGEAQVRAFFSADLVGSTRLKNRLNHQELYEKFRARKSVAERLVLDDLDAANRAVLESLGISTEDIDWAKVVEDFYRDLHSAFTAELVRIKELYHLQDLDQELTPWKAIGDELIYQSRIKSRKQLHWLTVAFLCALRTIDRKVAARPVADQGLRIKGSAWIAGFPVRNRIVELPMLRTSNNAVPVADFLGPDIDTGFRIGKCTRPGMLVVSVELAELLSECPADMNPITGKIVGWEQLKGVWDDKRYPVVWIDLPAGYPEANGELTAQSFDQWQLLECTLCSNWTTDGAAPLRAIAGELRDIRARLPKSLGLVDPYIEGDPDKPDVVPDEHLRIKALLDLVRDHKERVLKQDADEPKEETASSDPQVDDLLKGPGQPG